MELHMAKLVTQQQKQEESALVSVPRRAAAIGGGGVRGHRQRQQNAAKRNVGNNIQRKAEQEAAMRNKQAVDFFRSQTKKAKADIKKLMEDKRHLEDHLRNVNQDNSIWAQDVERLKSALQILQRKNKRLKNENVILNNKVAMMSRINAENMRLQTYANDSINNDSMKYSRQNPSKRRSSNAQMDNVNTQYSDHNQHNNDNGTTTAATNIKNNNASSNNNNGAYRTANNDVEEEGPMVQQQQPSLSSSSSKKNSRAMDSRPFGLGSASYAELSRARTATKKRALEVNHTMADGNRAMDDGNMATKQSVYPSSPSSEPMKRNTGNIATKERSNSSSSSMSKFHLDATLVVDDLEHDEVRVLTAKPRDISVLPRSNLSPSFLSLSPPLEEQEMSRHDGLKNPPPSSSSPIRRHRKSVSPRNRPRYNRSPSPKRNIAFGVPAELDSARDSHHRAHPKMGARQYFDQHSKRSKLATRDDVNSAERRRLHYRFPTQSNSAAQTPEQFQGALAVMAERSAVEDLIEERKKRQDTLQVLEWERVRHNESLSEEKMKYDKYLEKQRDEFEKEKQAALALFERQTELKILEERKRYEKKLEKELEKSEDNLDDKLARAKDKFNRSRKEFEKKVSKEKKVLEDRLKKEHLTQKENEAQQQKLLALVNELEEEVEEVKKRSALNERRASLASEALDHEREVSLLANESIDEQHELINIVQQLEKERDDAQRREAIAREALKREKLKRGAYDRHWKPNSHSSPRRTEEHGINLDSSIGSNSSTRKAKRSPFLRRSGGKSSSASKRDKIRNLASGNVVSKR